MRRLLFAIAVTFGVAACFGTMTKPQVYSAQLSACVATAKTKEESAACRASVIRAAGRDAGNGEAGAP